MTEEKVTVTFEGAPGTGKTTLQRLLVNAIADAKDWNFEVTDISYQQPTSIEVRLRRNL